MSVRTWRYNMSYFNQPANASQFSASDFVNIADSSHLYSSQDFGKPLPTASAMIPTANDISFAYHDNGGHLEHDRVFGNSDYNLQADDGYSCTTYDSNDVSAHFRHLPPHPTPDYCNRYDENGDLKPRKRRLPSVSQRRAANVRERRRMLNLNQAFDALRRRIPTFAYEKRLSRIETLRLAIGYITFMTEIIKGKDPNDVNVKLYTSTSMQLDNSISSLTNRLCNFRSNGITEGHERYAVTTGSGHSNESGKYSPVSESEIDYDK